MDKHGAIPDPVTKVINSRHPTFLRVKASDPDAFYHQGIACALKLSNNDDDFQ